MLAVTVALAACSAGTTGADRALPRATPYAESTSQRAYEAAVADPRVRAAIGERHEFTATSAVEPDSKDRPPGCDHCYWATFWSYDRRLRVDVEVDVDSRQVFEVITSDGTPPLSEREAGVVRDLAAADARRRRPEPFEQPRNPWLAELHSDRSCRCAATMVVYADRTTYVYVVDLESEEIRSVR